MVQFDDLVAIMVAEQVERDGLRASVQAETQRADREHAAFEAADQRAREAEAAASDLRSAVDARDATIVQLRARIAELEAGPVDPPTRRTLFGSCPAYPGGEYDGFGQPYELTTPAELAAWGQLIGG